LRYRINSQTLWERLATCQHRFRGPAIERKRLCYHFIETRGSVVVKTLCYKP
jgi:hypothetical protein